MPRSVMQKQGDASQLLGLLPLNDLIIVPFMASKTPGDSTRNDEEPHCEERSDAASCAFLERYRDVFFAVLVEAASLTLAMAEGNIGIFHVNKLLIA